MRRDCQHKQVHHNHGERNTYILDDCRCDDCREAQRAYEANRRKQQAYGRYISPYVDAEPVREHVGVLKASGMGLKTIAKKAGVSNSTLGNLIYGREHRTTGPSKLVRKETAAKVLAVKPYDVAGGVSVDATGTHRRIQALVATGWSLSRLAVKLDMHPTNMSTLLDRRKVMHSTAKKVRALYDELWDTPPERNEWRDKYSFSRARNYARDRGWLLPLEWDDDGIDNPNYQPETIVTSRKTVHVEDIEFLLDADPAITYQHVADRLNVRNGSIRTMLTRENRQDLMARLAFNGKEAAA